MSDKVPEPEPDPADYITRTHCIADISPNPLLRAIGTEQIEKWLKEIGDEYELVKDEYQDLRHHEYVWKLGQHHLMLTTDGLVDSGNTIGFSKDFPESLEWKLVRKVCRFIIREKGIELQEGFEAEDIMDMKINTPEGFLVSEMEEEKQKEYMKAKAEIFKDLCDRLDGINSIEELENAIEKFYEDKGELTEEHL